MSHYQEDENLIGAVGSAITSADPRHNYTGHAVNQIVANSTAKLQRFKDWVHKYLDDHGVPHHPPGTHGAEGCRIGDRMDWLMAKIEATRKALREITEENWEPREGITPFQFEQRFHAMAAKALKGLS